jgi:hypothetical protein
MEEIIDIPNEKDALGNVDILISSLRAGIRALKMDFGFHIKGTFPEDRVNDLEWNVAYRLFSTRHHFQLLYEHILIIREKHQHNLKINSNTPFTQYHLEIEKRQISSLLDSVIFHLASLFDYIASLICHVVSKKTNSPDWVSLKDSAKNKSNIFSKENVFDVANVVIETDTRFVSNLYYYRSKVIHEVSDVCNYEYSINYVTMKITIWFLCSRFQRKCFKGFGEDNKKYTLAFFVNYLIIESVTWIAKIISTLKIYMEKNSRKDEIAANPKKGMIFYNSSGEVIQRSIADWKIFHEKFPS